MDAKLYFHKIDQFLDLSGRMGYVVHLKEKLQTISPIDLKMTFFVQNSNKDSYTCARVMSGAKWTSVQFFFDDF